MQSYSRRQIAVSFLAVLGCRFHLNAHSDAGEPAAPSKSPSANPAKGPQRPKARKYRADAAILFLGMTIYRRAAVGDGEASIDESGEGPSPRRTLFFAAGSALVVPRSVLRESKSRAGFTARLLRAG